MNHSRVKDLDSGAGSRQATHEGEVLGAAYVIELNVWLNRPGFCRQSSAV